jgi:aarF domain-containing kinase
MLRSPQYEALHYQAWLHRWCRAVGRWKSRRLFDLAVAAAIAAATKQRLQTQLEAAVAPPTNWKGWERKDWTDELLQSLGNSKLHRAWSALRRIVSLTTLAAPLVVLYPASLVSRHAHDWTWSYALWSIEQAGPTFIKLVQWATTRHDLFSPEFCTYFGQLRDKTAGHGWAATQTILKQDLGDHVYQYLQLDPKPIGSGCIAQVYKGTLQQAVDKYPVGTQVAVKVQHPGIWHKVCVDFYIMGKVAKFLEDVPYLNLRYLSLRDTVRQFRDIMLPQLDLTLEAQHLQRFNRDFASDDQVDFPKPLQGLTSQRVLTETFVYGTPILSFLKAPEAVRQELAYLGLTTTLKMIFLNDFLHGTYC